MGYSSNHGPSMDGRGEKKEVFEESGEMDKFGTEEERKWASKRIVLAGFSQGSVVTLLAALTGEYALGGVAVFSGFLPMRWELSKVSEHSLLYLCVLDLTDTFSIHSS